MNTPLENGSSQFSLTQLRIIKFLSNFTYQKISCELLIM